MFLDKASQSLFGNDRPAADVVVGEAVVLCQASIEGLGAMPTKSRGPENRRKTPLHAQGKRGHGTLDSNLTKPKSRISLARQ